MKKGQTIVSNIVLFVFIVVGLIILAIFSSVTSPILALAVSSNNITGGMGILAKYFNVVLVGALLLVGLILAFGGGSE